MLFEANSWKFKAPNSYKLISLEELATLLGPSQEWVSKMFESLEALGRHEGVNEETIKSPLEELGKNDPNMELKELSKVEDELAVKKSKLVVDVVESNSHESEVKPSDEKGRS